MTERSYTYYNLGVAIAGFLTRGGEILCRTRDLETMEWGPYAPFAPQRESFSYPDRIAAWEFLSAAARGSGRSTRRITPRSIPPTRRAPAPGCGSGGWGSTRSTTSSAKGGRWPRSASSKSGSTCSGRTASRGSPPCGTPGTRCSPSRSGASGALGPSTCPCGTASPSPPRSTCRRTAPPPRRASRWCSSAPATASPGRSSCTPSSTTATPSSFRTPAAGRSRAGSGARSSTRWTTARTPSTGSPRRTGATAASA